MLGLALVLLLIAALVPDKYYSTISPHGWGGSGGSGDGSTQHKPDNKVAIEYVIFHQVKIADDLGLYTGWQYHNSNESKPYKQFCRLESGTNNVVTLATDGVLENDLAQQVSNVGWSLADATRYAMQHCKWFDGQQTKSAAAPHAAADPQTIPRTPPTSEAITNVPPGTWYRPVPPTSSFYNPTPTSTAFADGRRDRLAFEQWINTLKEPGHGNMFDGAQHWARVRSDPTPFPCSGGTYPSWVDGCNAAKEKLSRFDVRRKNEPDYKAGWNAASAELETAPAPSLAVTAVLMQRDGGSYKLSGQINQAVTIDFVLDTGADGIIIPSKAIAELQKAGQVVERRGIQKWRDANGSLHEGAIVRLQELKIAGHVLRDINVQVTDNDDGLLGQEFLRHFASYKIDNQRDVLVLEPLSSS